MTALLFFIGQWKNNQRFVLVGLLLSIVLAFSSVALLSLSGWFIAASSFAGLSVITAAQFNYFIPSASIRFLALIRILSRYADRVINHDLTFHILANLRGWFYEKLIPLSPAELLSHRSGDLLNRIINDIDTLDHLYLNVLSPFFIALILTLSTTLFIACFSVQIAMTTCILIIGSTLIVTLIAVKKGKKIGHDQQVCTAQLRTALIDTLQGFIDLLLFVKKAAREKLIDPQNDTLIQAQQKASQLKAGIIATMTFFSGITVFFVLFFGITEVRNHHITGAELAMIILLIIAVFDQLLLLPLAALSLGKTISAATRLTTIASEKPSVIFSSQDKVIEHYDVSLHAISFYYPGKSQPIFTNFSLDIPMNTHLGINAPSGAGKSTLLQLIARIWDPTEGKIYLGAHDFKTLSEKNMRDCISLVTQQIHIFNASVRDNLTLMQNTFSDEQCFDVLEKMDLAEIIYHLPEKLDSPMGEFGKQFSGGQIRRMAIARALLRNAPIILLDEPSTGLDDALFERIWKNCENDFSRKTVIVATHDEKILRHMSQVILIEQASCKETR